MSPWLDLTTDLTTADDRSHKELDDWLDKKKAEKAKSILSAEMPRNPRRRRPIEVPRHSKPVPGKGGQESGKVTRPLKEPTAESSKGKVKPYTADLHATVQNQLGNTRFDVEDTGPNVGKAEGSSDQRILRYQDSDCQTQ